MNRYNKIILAQPGIREKMGCPKISANKVYCDPGFKAESSQKPAAGSEGEAQP